MSSCWKVKFQTCTEAPGPARLPEMAFKEKVHERLAFELHKTQLCSNLAVFFLEETSGPAVGAWASTLLRFI
jgi:hypothetical protein